MKDPNDDIVTTGMTLTVMNPEPAKVGVAETRAGRNPAVRSKTNSVAPNKLDSVALNRPEPETDARAGGTGHLEYEAKRRRHNDEEEMQMEANSKKRVAAEKTNFSNAQLPAGNCTQWKKEQRKFNNRAEMGKNTKIKSRGKQEQRNKGTQ